MQFEILASLLFLVRLSLASTVLEHQGNLENSAILERTFPNLQYLRDDGSRRPGEQILEQRATALLGVGARPRIYQKRPPIWARDPDELDWRIHRRTKRNILSLRTPKKKAATTPAAPAAPAAPPAPSKKEAKKIKSAAKLLNSDAQKELKKQNKDEQHAVKNLQKIQDKATKATAKTTAKNAKNEGKAAASLQKDQAALQKASTIPPGKSGAKAAAKAQAALDKAKAGLVKTQQSGANAMQKINAGENKALDKNAAKLDKGIQKAHSAQFNKDGVAKVHPTTWQKFKKVMGYIGTGILDVIPGTEEVGAALTIARTAATVGAKVAAKAAVKDAAKEGVKVAKEQGKDGVENALSGPKPVNPVTAAKTETEAQKAHAQANADNLKAQYQQAASHVQHPAATRKFKRDYNLADHYRVAMVERDAKKAAADTKADNIRAYYQNAAADAQQAVLQKAKRHVLTDSGYDDGKGTDKMDHNIVVRDPTKKPFVPYVPWLSGFQHPHDVHTRRAAKTTRIPPSQG
ncbi:hypothetical protein MMC26_006278 [Xylographa opegraphella]|nr:hypothetical protein [Xylographa opegraphella]